MKAKGGYVYIMASKNRNAIYNCVDLIYYELFEDIESAIKREKRLKKYKREWKDQLIQQFNPELKDLFIEVVDMR